MLDKFDKRKMLKALRALEVTIFRRILKCMYEKWVEYIYIVRNRVVIGPAIKTGK